MPKKNEDKKEKDLSMTDEKWNSRVERIEAFLSLEGNQEFLNSSEDIQDAVELIRMNIKRGNRDSTKRKNLYHQIRIEGMDWKVENYDTLETSWPVGHGQTSSLPVEVQGNLDAIVKMVEDAHIEFWNNNPIIQQVSIISDRNKEMGGSPFENALDFAAGKAFAVKTRWTKFYTDKRWDGTLDLEAGFGINPPSVEESDDSGESDESDDS